MSPQPVRVLFLCTHNRCRSILAEALTRHHGHPYLVAASAGSTPEGQVHPDTLANLQQHGIDISDLHSKSWHDMRPFQTDYSIAVCEHAAGESCPAWMETTPLIPWALTDPSKITHSAEREQAFASVIARIENEVRKWVRLLQQNPEQFHHYMRTQLARRSAQSLN